MENGEVQTIWKDVLRNPDKPLSFREHLAPLVTTDECELLLVDIAERVTGIRIEPASDVDPARLVFTLDDAAGEPVELLCWPPAQAVPASLPPSLATLLRLHNGMCFPDDGGWCISLNGLSAAGALETSFDPSYAEGVIPNPEALVVPIDSYSDWFIFHPRARIDDGEPALALLSHEGGGLDEPLSTHFGASGYMLRLIGRAVLGDGDERCEAFVT